MKIPISLLFESNLLYTFILPSEAPRYISYALTFSSSILLPFTFIFPSNAILLSFPTFIPDNVPYVVVKSNIEKLLLTTFKLPSTSNLESPSKLIIEMFVSSSVNTPLLSTMLTLDTLFTFKLLLAFITTPFLTSFSLINTFPLSMVSLAAFTILLALKSLILTSSKWLLPCKLNTFPFLNVFVPLNSTPYVSKSPLSPLSYTSVIAFTTILFSASPYILNEPFLNKYPLYSDNISPLLSAQSVMYKLCPPISILPFIVKLYPFRHKYKSLSSVVLSITVSPFRYALPLVGILTVDMCLS